MKKLLILMGVVGLSGMIIQIGLLTMFLNFFQQSSIVSGTIIGGWLIGLGCGGIFVSKCNLDKAPKYIYGFQYLLGATILTFAIFSNKIFDVLLSLSWMAFPLTFLFTSSIGLMSGTPFLLMNSYYKENKDKQTAKLFSLENFGAGASSIVAGVILLPIIGIQSSLVASSFLCFIVGFNFAPKNKLKTYAPLLILLLLFVPFMSADKDIIFKEQSAFGEVIVLDNGFLQINGRTQCSFYDIEELTERQIVNYSLTPFNSKDLDVINIGLGCGGTLNEIPKYTDKEIDIVEINKVVVKANKHSSDILDNKQFNLIVDDGINYLRDSDKLYDSIIIDIENPGVMHSSNIYTKESFKIIKDSLNDNGIFGLWIHPCSEKEYYDLIYNTLKSSFNYIYPMEEHIFIASNNKLDYKEYISKTKNENINTMDKNILSTFFISKCWVWDK